MPAPSTTSDELSQLQALVRSFAPQHRLAHVETLAGGVSAEMQLLELLGPGGSQYKLVLRRFRTETLLLHPDVALDEYRLLQALVSSELPVPKPVHLDQTCEVLPQPSLILEYVEGSTDPGLMEQSDIVWYLAKYLSMIHSIVPAAFDLKFLRSETTVSRRLLETEPEVPDLSLEEEVLRQALAELGPIPRVNGPRLLHGDFWPGNVLWNHDAVAAIIDWEDAMSGDPLSDLANTRLEILWAYGYEAMEQFTAQYLAHLPLDASALPGFDLLAALGPAGKLAHWGLDPSRELTMRNGHRLFVNQAMVALGLRPREV